MKPAKIAVICIAAVSAIGLALVVRAMGSSGEPTAVAVAAVEARPMAKVLVAAKDLEPGRRLTDGDLSWKDWPVDELNPLFITDGSVPVPAAASPDAEAKPADAKAEMAKKAEGAAARVTRAATDMATGGAKADYIGAVVREPILAGEPIVGRKIVRAGDGGYMAAYLEPGMRAMAIRVTVETAAGGFILPGDRADVLLTREVKTPGGSAGSETTKFVAATVMQNVKVLAIDQNTRAAENEQAVVGATATLEVSGRDAEVLALAKSEGELSLVLRSYADTAGPSGRVPGATSRGNGPASGGVVRVYREGAIEAVAVP
ncbi:pilus assembly protein CpaB [Brevundimonas bullata]|uniref:Pilus assembly protein CpaB n=1 Tax=Brevundimonas bullata TaxID=13160 RepID=A0A7W7N4B1_9CAUL|nr:Flp pilus assembly protein CpaB [Brevundimonas bullata]MBB4798077.1 pilus assembly protein CpaB [Brevundimonas bullata]MBB6383609.1 pilus assembly protein CpaB [Brevundimonas bullata]